MSEVRLSVITATVGRRELMLRKLASLEAQTLPADRFEWIVCENGGSDGTLDALRSRRPAFALRTVRLEQNRGPGQGRNAAAQLASGEVLYLSDDDCLLRPDTLERHLEAQARPCLALGGIVFRADPRSAHEWRPKRVGFWNVNGANTSFPASAFHRAGGFDGSLQGYGGEDVLLGYQLAGQHLPMVALKDAPVDHIGPDAMASGDSDKAWSAGANAGRIAQRYPNLALRLGVHPLLLFAKCAALPLLSPLFGRRARAELAYARGAREVLNLDGPAAATGATGRSSQ